MRALLVGVLALLFAARRAATHHPPRQGDVEAAPRETAIDPRYMLALEEARAKIEQQTKHVESLRSRALTGIGLTLATYGALTTLAASANPGTGFEWNLKSMLGTWVLISTVGIFAIVLFPWTLHLVVSAEEIVTTIEAGGPDSHNTARWLAMTHFANSAKNERPVRSMEFGCLSGLAGYAAMSMLMLNAAGYG